MAVDAVRTHIHFLHIILFLCVFLCRLQKRFHEIFQTIFHCEFFMISTPYLICKFHAKYLFDILPSICVIHINICKSRANGITVSLLWWNPKQWDTQRIVFIHFFTTKWRWKKPSLVWNARKAFPSPPIDPSTEQYYFFIIRPSFTR